MPIAPCEAAGNISSIAIGVPVSDRPKRSSPAAANKVAVNSPLATFAIRVATLPLIGAVRKSGRSAFNCAARRGLDVPTSAFCGSVAIESAPINRSRTSARGSIAAIWKISGRTVSTSFIECTAMSMVESISARSSSLVHKALPPISASGRLWSLSPDDNIGTRCTVSAAHPCAAHKAALVISACAKASGEDRVPIRKGWEAEGVMRLVHSEP